MPRRLFLALLLIAALAPVTWLRSHLRPFSLAQELTIKTLPLPADCCRIGPLHLTGAWQLASPNQQFGGYSALVQSAPGRLLAISDAGYTLEFPEPGERGPVHLSTLFAPRAWRKQDRDTEAAQRDPATGQLWIASEGRNLVMRFDRKLQMEAYHQPAAMRRWPANTGPEAIARLANGRTIALCECTTRWRDQAAHPALLFTGDPAEGAEPFPFYIAGPWQFRPTDMAVLPDGRVLVLQRRLIWPFPMRFSARLGLLDPRGIAPGAVVEMKDLGEFPADVPMDNYEGLALEPLGQGRMAAWMISDDNNADLQRSLLLAFEFQMQDLPQ